MDLKFVQTIDEHYISRIYEGLGGSFSFAGGDFDLEIKKVYPEVNNGLFEVDMAFKDTIPNGIRRGQTLQNTIATQRKYKSHPNSEG